MIRTLALAAVLFATAPPGIAGAQEPKDDKDRPPQIFGGQLGEELQKQAAGNVPPSVMIASIIVFGVGIFIATVAGVAALAWLRQQDKLGEVAFSRLFALVLLVGAISAMVFGGFSALQLAAALGFLGTIAGYMLGSQRAEQQESGASAASASPPTAGQS